MHLIEMLISLFLIYLVLGLLHAACFMLAGLGRVDPVARDGGAAFKAMVLPGIILLWPVMLGKWVRA